MRIGPFLLWVMMGSAFVMLADFIILWASS